MKIEQDLKAPSATYRSQSNESSEGSLNLGQVIAALRRRILLIGGVTALVSFGAVYRALTDTPIYSAQFEILTQPLTAETQVISTIPDTLTSTEKTTGVVDENMLKVLTSPSVISPIVNQLKVRYPDFNRGILLQNLTVDSALKSNSKILVVSYQDQNSERVKAVLNAVSAAFLDYSLKSRQADVRQGLDFVKAQVPEQQQRVEVLQQQLQQLRQQYKLVDPDSRGNQLSGQLATFSQQQLDTEIQLKQLRAVQADLEKQMRTQSNEMVGSSALDNAPRYQSILNQLLSADDQIAQASITYQDTSLKMQYLRQQREKLLALLSQEGERVQIQIDSRLRELEARDRALRETISSLNGGITELSTISHKYANIQRELQVATDNLNQFLAKQAALEIDAAQRKTPWELLTPPTYPQVSAVSVRRNLILGIVLGLLLGSGSALALDKLSNILHSSRDIKLITKLPILGVIPFNPDLAEFNVDLAKFKSSNNTAAFLQDVYGPKILAEGDKTQKAHNLPFIEAFRFLYTNIYRFNPDVPVRSLVVSSPVSADGKSTVALHLAQAAASIGKRVLLVDADLRRPQLHHYLGLNNNRRGLTDVIAGDANPGDVIRQSSLDPNLFVLTTGLIPPEPTRFLSSQKMQTLMEKSPEIFDLVIYDTPPLLSFADASLITSYVDEMILVVGLGKIKSSLLEQALEQLRVSSIPVLGIVANNSRESVPNIQSISEYYYQPEYNEQHIDEETSENGYDASSSAPSFLKNWNLN